ncbi:MULTISPECIES: bifunctional phosphopantothenoylcysteine decarboxylase/phosphopantothenate--cysteine ligase CoaBC [Lactobacillus]|uniref:Coenzyme A biosynthesis bifunctional protein CoaBC n=1 Tax=Lactobacillus xujianguonis TaxID=2495899 RepID=A0A437SUY5_9LACO|nr:MULTISPECIES: bifunctional phosphopantothenoylcysteine decarboxylase/phosphopantothenate--cysteine ligase CoaBC [Lactobacillus]RVU70627.1 bifunctional phosphopantothenoylcysteine decarboxylase/phosphopantothenate--cysteine ligase CoaBC [Lactobacillus xujianguonis]RVU73836.1 bifunctional phosphopantothenoylcysteine decarboxylase/phosphopantothenate--cysteine ligase CoaBC [Lactobacillus xujianguonis]
MKITVYLTGGIAIYKAIEVVRGLEKEGHQVRVVMTKNAEKLVTSNTLAALTKAPVLDDLWTKENEATIPHVHLAQWTELALVVPATADFIAKMSLGIADDAASTTILATGAQKLVVPAMNDQMWFNPAVQRNLTQLQKDGVRIMSPAVGMLAEGYAGKGRMPEPQEILAWVKTNFSSKLAGKKVLVTAGGTSEPIDPVRYIGNRSSGKMGIALAEAARDQGAEVTLIYGHITVQLPSGVKLVSVETSEEMEKAVLNAFPKMDALIMAAAVADWRSEKPSAEKIKKKSGQTKLDLALVKTNDILQKVSQLKKEGQIVIGFAAETQDLLTNAQKKLKAKGADYIVANDVSKGVFGSDEDQVIILSQKRKNTTWPRMTKTEIAQKLVSELLSDL